MADIGIDLGTHNLRVYSKRRGILFTEPTLATKDKKNKIIAIGIKAKEMVGKVPMDTQVVRPVQQGVIVDYATTEVLLAHFIQRACGRLRFIKPNVLLSVPSQTTSVERRAFLSCIKKAGSKAAHLVDSAFAAAVGDELSVSEPEGCMVVLIGGGITDIAVISLGGVVEGFSLPVGGETFDKCIIEHVKKTRNVLIGEVTAEDIKKTIGSAYPRTVEQAMSLKGRDLNTGLPRIIELTSSEVRESFLSPLQQIVEGVKRLMAKTPPELISDIMENGLTLCGGGSRLTGIDHLLSSTAGVPARYAGDPEASVIKGIGKMVEEAHLWKILYQQPLQHFEPLASV